MPRDKRQKRDMHALDENGMVLCNPRDREAAHRAEVEGIATADQDAVTCRKCVELLHRHTDSAHRHSAIGEDPHRETTSQAAATGELVATAGGVPDALLGDVCSMIQ